MVRSSAKPGVALVLCATGAIGSAIVARLKGDGLRIAAISPGPCDEAELSIVADAGVPEEVAAAVDRTVRELGPINVLVTALGDRDEHRIGEAGPQLWAELLDSHLRATANACRSVLPRMIEAGGGTVVTLTTHGALTGGAIGHVYESAAAGTILAFTKSLAAEVAPSGVRMNCIALPPSGAAAAVADTVAFLVGEGDFYVGQVFVPSANGDALS